MHCSGGWLCTMREPLLVFLSNFLRNMKYIRSRTFPQNFMSHIPVVKKSYSLLCTSLVLIFLSFFFIRTVLLTTLPARFILSRRLHSYASFFQYHTYTIPSIVYTTTVYTVKKVLVRKKGVESVCSSAGRRSTYRNPEQRRLRNCAQPKTQECY